jgi:hypothetical protein
MSGEGQDTQVETQVVQVEEEYLREEKHEHKTMDVKVLPPKFNASLLVKAYGDNLSTGSFKFGGGDHPFSAALFLQYDPTRVEAPIGDPTISGENPQMAKNWSFWMTSANPNSHKLTTEHEGLCDLFLFISFYGPSY